MGTLGRSWELTKLSWSVVRKDKSLLAFPIISAVISIIAFIGIVAPFLLFAGVEQLFEENSIAAILMFVILYIVLYFLAIFFQVATLACAMHVMDGNNTTVGYGLRFAASKVKRIFQWAVISAIIGLILSRIRQLGPIGSLISFLGGLAWAVATFFVVPIMVFEDVGPFEAIKRSAGMVRSTIGPTIVSNLSLGLIFFLLFVLGFVIFIPLLIMTAGGVLVWVVLLCFFIYITVLALLASLLSKVLVAVLYRYGKTGKSYMDVDKSITRVAGVTPPGHF